MVWLITRHRVASLCTRPDQYAICLTNEEFWWYCPFKGIFAGHPALRELSLGKIATESTGGRCKCERLQKSDCFRGCEKVSKMLMSVSDFHGISQIN
jgi:hypothetical protein